MSMIRTQKNNRFMMRVYFVILFGIASTCKAQRNIDTIQYYSEHCNQYLNYQRQYLNDSMHIERHGDVTDTFILKEECMYLIRKNVAYKIIDADRDFDSSSNGTKFHYYYYGLSPADTLKKENESDVQYGLKLDQRIVIYVPAKVITSGNSLTFSYYVMGDCYPVNETCIRSRIINGQYDMVYFEKGIGYTGHGTTGKCSYYKITDRSYKLLHERRRL